MQEEGGSLGPLLPAIGVSSFTVTTRQTHQLSGGSLAPSFYSLQAGQAPDSPPKRLHSAPLPAHHAHRLDSAALSWIQLLSAVPTTEPPGQAVEDVSKLFHGLKFVTKLHICII